MSAHHGDPNIKIRTKSDKKWLEFGAQCGKLVNEWAGRDDLVTFVGPNGASQMAGQQKPTALFNPQTLEIEINTDTAFGTRRKPKDVGDFTTLTVQREFPAAAGAVLHEAGHARFTSWDLVEAHKTLKPDEYQALHLLEETRMEGMLVDVYEKYRPFLRACALDIVLQDMLQEPVADEDGKVPEPPSAVQVMGNLAGLSMARVDAGVLDNSDIKKCKLLIEKNLPEDTVHDLRNIWLSFQRITRVTDPETVEIMYDLAREWARILRELAEERGEQMTQEQMEQMMQAVADAVGDDAMSAEAGAGSEIERQELQEGWEQEVKERMEANRQRDKDVMASKETFDPRNRRDPDKEQKRSGRGTQDYWGRTEGSIVDERPPTGAERTQATRLSKALERAKYHDRVRTVSPDAAPPGRLRMRAAVQGAAYKAVGVHTQTEPWKKVTRKHTIDPNLTVGIMVDVSGSMSDAMQPMASIAWIVSEAVRKIQGRAAMVYYGNQVIPALYPGEHLERVRVRSANDGTERFDLAFRSLNGALNLTDSSGARLLVVVSDGHYTDTERKAAREHMKRCADTGIAVVWLGIESRWSGDPAIEYCAPHPTAEHKYVGKDLADYARVIGDACERALNRAGAE